MNVQNPNSLPTQAHLNRSVSGLNKASLKPNVSTSSKSPGMVSKFLKNVSNFFKRLFFGAKPQPKSTSLPPRPNISTVDVNSAPTKSSESVYSKTIDVKTLLTPKLQQRFGIDSLLMLSKKAEAAGVSKDLESLNKMSGNITSKNINDFNSKVDVFLSKLSYHEVFNDIQTFVSNSKLNKFTSVNQLRDTLAQEQTEFPSSDGKSISGRTASDYDNRLVNLKQTVQSFKAEFVKELSATDSNLKKDISVIKQNVMKSTETYVKSGEFDQKKMVADLISRNKKFVNLAFNSSRITSSLEQVKKKLEGNDIQSVRDNLQAIRDVYNQYNGVGTFSIQSTNGVDVSSASSRIDQGGQSVDSGNSTISSIGSIYDTLTGNVDPNSTDPVENTLNTIKDLFSELNFNMMATTLQGDQYLKGWNTGGRSEADIKQDILTLLNNDRQMFNDISHTFDTIMKGLSGKVHKSARQMIDATFQKDSMMASMKSIHEMTMGLDQFVSNLGQTDLSHVSLSKLSSSVDDTFKMVSNFQALSTDFIVGEHTLTHLSSEKVKSMIMEFVPQLQFKDQSHVNHFIGLMTDYVMHRLEHKHVIDSKENDYGTIHLDNLSKIDLKDQMLIKMDEYKRLNNDKITSFTGSITSRGPFNNAFHRLTNDENIKFKLEQFLKINNNPTIADFEHFFSNYIQTFNTVDSNQVDQRAEIITQLSGYTMSLLKKNGVIATGDSGLIKEAELNLISKKSTFKQSDLNRLYSEQFNLIAPKLQSRINSTLKTGLEQGQVGKLRGIVNDLKSQRSLRKNISENLKFKTKLATNHIKSFYKNTFASLRDANEFATNVNDTLESITETDSEPSDVVAEHRDQLDEVSSSIDEGISSVNESINSAADTMVQVQNSVNRLLNSDLSKSLLQIKSSSESDGFNLEMAADSLKSVVSNVESELTSLKSILVSSANIAFDHVDDVLMSVPYVGELYSAMALAKDIKDGYFANEKMTDMRTQIDTVTGFNHYVASSSLNPETVPSNVEAFTNFMHAEKTRNKAAFSLLVHVGNALSPPGVNVGSLMKAVKSAVSLPELQDEDLQSIAKEVMTVNSNITALAREEKSVGLNKVMSTLKRQDSGLEDFTKAIYDVSYHLPTANDFEVSLNQTMFAT